MRETTFIQQNQQKWAKYEERLYQSCPDADQLREMFVHITDDLAYARTFYPNRSVHHYLNGLAQQIFRLFHRSQYPPFGQILSFWTDEMPRLLWESRRALGLSFGLFILSMAIGVVSSHADPDFARYILGEQYVNMTLENIERGDPMAVYKNTPPLGMSIGIAANNVSVALMTVLSGVFTSLGTVLILIRNGIMVGVFQYFFIERGLFWPSFLTIWIHGTLEISAIIVAGAAGLTIGSGLLFPGTYTRRQAFQRSARRGIFLFLGLVPVFVLAAFFEGFLTRHTEAPDALRLSFILLSLLLVLGYFVALPWWKARQRSFENVFNFYEPVIPMREPILFSAIKNPAETLSDAFRLLFRHLSSVARYSLLASGATSGAWWLQKSVRPARLSLPNASSALFSANDARSWLAQVGNLHEPFLLGAEALLLCTISVACLRLLQREMPEDFRNAHRGRWYWPLAIGSVICCAGTLVIANNLGTVVAYSWAVFLSLWLNSLYFSFVGQRLPLYRLLFQPRAWLGAGVIGLVSGALFGLSLIANPLTVGALVEFFRWLIPAQAEWQQTYYQLASMLWVSFSFHICWMLATWGGALEYFSLREKEVAWYLFQKIDQVGICSCIRGLARE